MEMHESFVQLDGAHVLRVCKIPAPITNVWRLVAVRDGVDDERAGVACRGVDAKSTKPVSPRRKHAILVSVGNCHEVSCADLFLNSSRAQNCWVDCADVTSYCECVNVC